MGSFPRAGGDKRQETSVSIAKTSPSAGGLSLVTDGLSMTESQCQTPDCASGAPRQPPLNSAQRGDVQPDTASKPRGRSVLWFSVPRIRNV